MSEGGKRASRKGSSTPTAPSGGSYDMMDVEVKEKGFGILDKYPRLAEHFDNFVAFLQLLRPITLLAPILACFFGVGAQMASVSTLDMYMSRVYTIVYASLTLALAHGASQVFNQVADVDIDKVNKPHRPIPDGDISEDTAMGVGLLLFIFTFARAFTINLRFGILVSLILFFGVFYSFKPLRIKKRGCWLPLVWMALSRGLLPFLAVWSIFGDPTSPYPWMLGTVATLWVFAFQSTKDFPDMHGDRLYNVDTLPLRYGKEGATLIMQVSSIFPVIALFYFIFGGYLSLWFLIPYFGILSLIPFILASYGDKQSYTENTTAWVLFYGGLGLFYILSFVAFLLN